MSPPTERSFDSGRCSAPSHCERTAFIVFARDPAIGRVKTRLAATVGDARALEIYRWLGSRTVTAVREAARRQVTASVLVAHTCAGDTREIVRWFGDDLAYRAQCSGDLGARMRDAIASVIAEGADVAIVVGTDCPSLDADALDSACAALRAADVVLGPATDGGYYLIATRAPHPALFEGIPWSSADTLRFTIEAARRAGLGVALLDERRDIDTADDWDAWVTSGRHDAGAPFPSGR